MDMEVVQIAAIQVKVVIARVRMDEVLAVEDKNKARILLRHLDVKAAQE
jgi:hypothetical protein